VLEISQHRRKDVVVRPVQIVSDRFEQLSIAVKPTEKVCARLASPSNEVTERFLFVREETR